MIRRFATFLLMVIGLCGSLAAAEQEGGGPPEFKHLKYRLVGPFIGGRVSRSAGVPGDPLTYYGGTASGGVWKSTDGGYNWKPIFDKQPVSSIGSLAIAPSDPNVIYVGTGEANIRGNVAAGNGIYKSSDGGKTWKHVWNQEGQIGTTIVHPTNPDIAFAAVLGHAFGPNAERGVYRTTDGGKNWKQVLFKDRDTGASDVAFDPSNPNILFAGLWQARRRPWEFTSGGPGSGLYMSRDGGDTWQQLGPKTAPEVGAGSHPEASGRPEPARDVAGKGLPPGIWGKVCVAVAPSDGRRIYAMIEAEQGGLFRSDDGGDNWKLINGHHYLRQRPWYFSTITIDPTNAEVIWCPTVPLLKSIDGGQTFKKVKGPHHVDHHHLWIDPRNPKRMIDSNDGGVDITVDGEHWYAPPMALAQFYHVAADNRLPYSVSGCMQDFGSASGPSNSLSTGGISRCDWQEVGGGEAGFTAPDSADPNIVYAGEYGGYISRYDQRTRQARNISVYPTNPSGHGAEDLRYRFQWTAPILVSPQDPKVVYHAGNVLFKSADGGMHWTPMSPDLTRNDKAKQKWSGGPITGDNTGAEYYDTIFALAESPKQKDLLWAGSDDGLVHVSRDGGKNWANVTPPGLPEWGTIAGLEASPFDAGTAYVVVDAHRLDDTHPYLFKTSDYGKTWKSLTAKLPPDIYLHAVREDPRRKGLLYLGTERGVSFSTDDGSTWQELKLNLPAVAVHDLVVKGNDLVVGTHGRSIWILDDLTPIREMSPQIVETNVHLFAIQPAMRWRYHGPFHHKGRGENPPRGAILHYYLKKKPQGDISLAIYDADGGLVAKLSSKKEPPPIPEDDPDAPSEPYKKTVLTTETGVNRVAWDLRYDGALIIKGGKVEGDPLVGPLVNPGVYTAKLTVDGQTLSTAVSIKMDPRLQVSTTELEEQLKFALGIRDSITQITRRVSQIRSISQQISSRNELLKENPKAGTLIKQGQELITKLAAVEAKLHNPKAEVTYDILAQRGGAQLYSKLAMLLNWASDADGLPTQGMRDVYNDQRRELQQLEAELDAMVSNDLARLNETAQKLDIPNIIVPGKPATSKPPPTTGPVRSRG